MIRIDIRGIIAGTDEARIASHARHHTHEERLCDMIVQTTDDLTSFHHNHNLVDLSFPGKHRLFLLLLALPQLLHRLLAHIVRPTDLVERILLALLKLLPYQLHLLLPSQALVIFHLL